MKNRATSTGTAIIFLTLLVIMLIAIFAHHLTSKTSLISDQAGVAQLLGSSESGEIQEWKISEWPSMKYRILFKGLIIGTAKILGGEISDLAFYRIYIGWCFILTLLTLVTLYYFLGILGFSHPYRFFGGFLFLFSFPVLFAYNYPVFTREDTLAFLLVTLGLVFLVKRQLIIAGLIAALAILARETGIILAIAIFFGSSARPLNRLMAILPAIAAFFAVRLIVGYESYNIFAGFFRNLQLPLESLFFLFICFGFLWLSALAGWNGLRKSTLTGQGQKIIARSFPWVLTAILAAAIAFSILRENRVTFIIFPWMIALTLFWIRDNSDKIRAALMKTGLIIPLAILFILASMASVIVLNSSQSIQNTGIYKILIGSIIRSHTNLAKVFETYPDIQSWIIIFLAHATLLIFGGYILISGRKRIEKY
jgi:hypothetical protein